MAIIGTFFVGGIYRNKYALRFGLALAGIGLGLMFGVGWGTVAEHSQLHSDTGDHFSPCSVEGDFLITTSTGGDSWIYPLDAPHIADLKKLLRGKDPHLKLSGCATTDKTNIYECSVDGRTVLTYGESSAYYRSARHLRNIPLGILGMFGGLWLLVGWFITRKYDNGTL